MTTLIGGAMRPVHQIRYGNVEAAIWANNSSAGYFYNTTFRRTYKTDDIWAESSSFDDRSLLNLAKAAQDVHSWIFERKAEAERPQESDTVEELD